MEKRRLGSTGLMVSVIGFGGIPIQRKSSEEVIEIFGELIKNGINFIDTARGYTVSEELIGKALKVHGRENFIIATKSMDRTSEGLLKEFKISMRNLDIDFIDLFQFHNVKTEEEYEKLIGENGGYSAALKLKEEGLIKHLGITSHNKDLLEKIIESGLFETIQFPYNAVETQAEEHLKLASEKDMGVIIMKPLAGGAIMNKNLALRFAFEKDFITSLIPGMDSVEQVSENADIGLNFIPLNDEEKEVLNREVEELGSHFCRRCGYCAPCSIGIDIPTNFLMEGYYTRYNLKEWATERYNSLEPNAGDCIKCGDCEPRCPYDLKIMSMLDEVDYIFNK